MSASHIAPAGHIPPAFLQILGELEQSITDTLASEKTASKKMAPVKAKAVSSLRQALRKKAKEFETLLKTYNEVRHLREWRHPADRQDPEAYSAAYDKANVIPTAPKAPKKVQIEGQDAAADGDFMTIGRGGRALNLTAEGTFKTLQEVFESRGKKVGGDHLMV